MANALQLVGRGPANNPDTLTFKATFSGTYAGPELLNLTPVSGANAGGFTDPGGLGPPYPDRPLTTAPSVADDLGGPYTELHLGSTLLNCALHVYQSNGTEVVQGAAFPAGVTAGSTLITVKLPQMQA